MNTHQKKTYTCICNKFLFLAVLLAVFFVLISPLSANSHKTPIYFYSCETDINNFKFLKMEFDAYLSNLAPYEFLPFNDREVFENHIRTSENFVIIVSGWHYFQIHKQYNLSPLMVGVKNGKTHQKRILVADSSSAAESVKTGQIASATGVQHTLNELKTIFKDDVDSSRILTVPRDIDALMSMGIGISQCALVTENSLEKLNTIHPSLFKRMTTVAEGKPSWLLIVATPEKLKKNAEDLIRIFKNMQTDPLGKGKVKMLGLDGWEAIENIDRLKTEGLQY